MCSTDLVHLSFFLKVKVGGKRKCVLAVGALASFCQRMKQWSANSFDCFSHGRRTPFWKGIESNITCCLLLSKEDIASFNG